MDVLKDFWKTSLTIIVNNIEPVTKMLVFLYKTRENNLKIQVLGKSASGLVKSGNMVENTYLYFKQSILYKLPEDL